MQTKKNVQDEANFIPKPLSAFVQYYNQNIPASFPRASAKILQKFKETHEELFKEGSEWTVDKHRKKLMDWITSNREVL